MCVARVFSPFSSFFKVFPTPSFLPASRRRPISFCLELFPCFSLVYLIGVDVSSVHSSSWCPNNTSPKLQSIPLRVHSDICPSVNFSHFCHLNVSVCALPPVLVCKIFLGQSLSPFLVVVPQSVMVCNICVPLWNSGGSGHYSQSLSLSCSFFIRDLFKFTSFPYYLTVPWTIYDFSAQHPALSMRHRLSDITASNQKAHGRWGTFTPSPPFNKMNFPPVHCCYFWLAECPWV